MSEDIIEAAPQKRTLDMYKLYLEGLTLEAIGKVYRLHTASVSSIFKKAGFKIERRWAVSDDILKEAHEYYKSGVTLREMEKKFGVTIKTLSKGFNRLGLSPIKKNRSCIDRVIFKGNSYFEKNGYYVRQTPCGKGTSLHRDTWEHHNGVLASGMVIHHIDEDINNNNITNLQAMSIGDHVRHHSKIKSLIKESKSK